MDYRSGLWLLGPNSLCDNKICYFGYAIENTFSNFKPSTAQDVDFIINHFKGINRSIYDYIDVLNAGIVHGMVRTKDECLAGLNALKYYYLSVSKYGANGTLFYFPFSDICKISRNIFFLVKNIQQFTHMKKWQKTCSHS